MKQVKKLEMLCFHSILWRLEDYKIEKLSLLPKKYRVKALLQLPIVDVCKLENTQFTVDIAMDTIWEQLYQKYIGPTDNIKPKEENWKQLLLSKAVNTILNCGRVFGYFHKETATAISTTGINKHPADNINYLVAMKHNETYIKEKEESMPVYDELAYIAQGFETILTCYQVTLCKGVVPPGKAYEESCEIYQIVPPRYAILLNPGSRYLPNLTALELLQQYDFRPKSIDISIPTFGAFLLHAQQERPNFMEFLRKFLSTVESVTFCDPQNETPRKVKLQERIEDSSPKLLQQGIEMIISSTLKSVSITIADFPEPLIKCITPILTRAPCSLQAFKYSSEVQLHEHYFEQLESILLHHITLKTVSLNFIDKDEDLLEVFPILSKYICPWVKISLASRSLALLEIYLHTTSMGTFLDMLTMFLSAPCAQEQTLSLKIVFAQGRGVSKNRNADHFTEQLEKVDKRFLQRKSIEFVRHVSFKPKFNPIRLRGLIATRIPSGRICTLVHQFITTEVQINKVNLRSFTTVDHYSTLLQGKLLASIKFNNCTNIQTSLLEQAATEHGFKFEVTTDTDSKTLYTLTK